MEIIKWGQMLKAQTWASEQLLKTKAQRHVDITVLQRIMKMKSIESFG